MNAIDTARIETGLLIGAEFQLGQETPEPILNPQPTQRGGDALVLVIDDGWTAAPRWREKLARAGDILEAAERDGRPALLITTAAPASGEAMQPGQLMPAADLRPVVAALQPKPWASDRAALVQALVQSRMPDAADVAVVRALGGPAGFDPVDGHTAVPAADRQPLPVPAERGAAHPVLVIVGDRPGRLTRAWPRAPTST